MSYIGNAPAIQSTEFREEYFPTASQTAFVTGGFHPSAVSVTRNGVLLSESDYTKGTDNVTITLASAAVSGDVVVIRGNRSLAQGVSVSESRVEHTWQSGDNFVQLNTDVIPAYTDVYLNGVKLAAADYTIDANAKTVSFNGVGQTAPAVGDVIAVVHKNETSALVALPLKDSAGNEILSESGSVVSIGTLRLPTSGGIQDSSGANVLTEASGTVTLTADEANIGSNALVVDSSGNVGVGTSSLTSKLTVNTSSNNPNDSANAIRIEYPGGYDADDLGGGLVFAQYFVSSQTSIIRTGGIFGVKTTSNGNFGGGLAFYTQPLSSADMSERMRIDSSGNVLVGRTTAAANRGVIQAQSSITGGPGQFSASNTNYSSGSYDWSFGMNNLGAFVLYINPAVSGNLGVYLNAGATSWTGNSDERLKDITGEIVDAVASVCSLRAVKYTLKADEQEIKTQRVGLIAQDVQAVLPEIVDEDPEGYLGIRYSEVAPLLVKAIQEQQALIESQQSQIDALTARIEALEATP